jgi:hypothetical protein
MSDPTLMARVLKLCERMAAGAIEMRLITRLPLLVESRRTAPCASPPSCESCWRSTRNSSSTPGPRCRALAAVDEAARTFIEGPDRDGWREVLLATLEVDDPPANVIALDAWRSAPGRVAPHR